MKNILFFILVFIGILSCKKDDKIYTGIIVDNANGCSIPPGIPFKIKFDDVTQLDAGHPIRLHPALDSSCMADLPDEFQIIGRKIQFNFRDLNDDDYRFTCDGNVAYWQVVLCNIRFVD